MLPIDERAFEQLSQYAAMLKDGAADKAAVLRATIMRERHWDYIEWIYARDAWLLLLRDKIHGLYQQDTARWRLAMERDGRPPPDENDAEINRLNWLIEDDRGYPIVMSLAETALLLDGIRHPGIMRHVVERHLSDLVHNLRRNEFDGTPDREIYVENSTAGLVAALRPMLLNTVNAFFAMSDAERAQLKANRDNLRQEMHDAMLADPEMAGEIDNGPPTAFDLTWVPFLETIRGLNVAERHRLAVELVTKPDAMVANVQAAEVLREVLDLMPGSEINDLPPDHRHILYAVCSAPSCSNLLPLLRDLRRALC